MISPDPYLAAGMSRNPFAWVDHHDPGPFLDRGMGEAPPAGRRLFVQVIGVKGAGKTTTLAHWQAMAPGPYHHVPPSGRVRWTMPPVGAIVYWDEVDRMPAPVRSRALRRAARVRATVVLGTHEDLAHLGRGHGFEVRTIELPAIGAAELERWATERIDAVRLPGIGSVPAPAASDYPAIAAAAGGSWRVAGDLLHARVAAAVAGLGSAVG